MTIILKDNEKLTPYVFYSRFLLEVAEDIRKENDIEFKLFENGDENVFDSNYSIEPITIPLILSLSEQLSKYYSKPINLALFNNHATKNVLKFLFSSDFFYVSGNNQNPAFPIGRNFLSFDEKYLGDFIEKDPRPEHRVRCYTLNDHEIQLLDMYKSDEEKRDYLISEYVYIVKNHFQELLYDNINTNKNLDVYVEILSELITNGVLHSKSETFALMFVNRFSTKFSISDNGIGFTESLKKKSEDELYKPLELLNKIKELNLLHIHPSIQENLYYIIETLYYSCLKDRRGLFDLMISVVLDSEGYFRLHSENSQIIISSRMTKDLEELKQLRNKLFNIHRTILINGKYEGALEEMVEIKNQILTSFISLFTNICDRYNENPRYSSLRFFNVKFRGVHIEVEIPNTK